LFLESIFFENYSMTMKAPGAALLAPSPTDFSQYDNMYYIKGAAAGGICCSLTHGALTPVDVVKTRVQLDPVKVCSPEPQRFRHNRKIDILEVCFDI
jgi:hypothetical protein